MEKDLVELINEIVGLENIPKKYAPRQKSESNPPIARARARCRNGAHKYLRFSKRNKTYRIDTYYCVQCPSTIPIPNIIGRTTKCWKCDDEFTVGIGYFPLKPSCNKCRGLESKESNNNDLVEELMGVIEKSII